MNCPELSFKFEGELPLIEICTGFLSANAFLGVSTTGAAICDVPEVGIGGSAMPCGLVLPAARAKLVEGDERAGGEARGVVELVDPVGPAVDDPEVADAGRVERDARRAGAGAGDGPAPEQRARQRVLEHLVGGGVVDDPESSYRRSRCPWGWCCCC